MASIMAQFWRDSLPNRMAVNTLPAGRLPRMLKEGPASQGLLQDHARCAMLGASTDLPFPVTMERGGDQGGDVADAARAGMAVARALPGRRRLARAAGSAVAAADVRFRGGRPWPAPLHQFPRPPVDLRADRRSHRPRGGGAAAARHRPRPPRRAVCCRMSDLCHLPITRSSRPAPWWSISTLSTPPRSCRRWRRMRRCRHAVTLDLKAVHEKAAALLERAACRSSIGRLLRAPAAFAQARDVPACSGEATWPRPTAARPRAVLRGDAAREGRGRPKPRRSTRAKDVALLQYTGGTTGGRGRQC